MWCDHFDQGPPARSPPTRALRSPAPWRLGLEPGLIARLLADAAFGPGAVGWPDQDHLGAGVGILVEEARDPDLARVFDQRRKIRDDQEFLAKYEASAERLWAILSPEGPEALIGVQAAIKKPRRVRRTFLLLASRHAHILGPLTQPGSTLWLIPDRVAQREWVKEGAGSAYDLWRESLPVGQITAPIQAVQLALGHTRQPAS